MNTVNEIWIGLAELMPLDGCTLMGEAKGAFVNVVGWADSSDAFYSKIERIVATLHMKLLSLEDAEPFSQRSSRWEVDDSILQMIDTATENQEDLVFGTFHFWHNADA